MAYITNTQDQQGISFPLTLDNGRVVVDGYKTLIERSILNILYWPIKSMPFDPSFGTRLEELIGEPNTSVLAVLAKRFLIDALSTYERRISILELTITMPTASSMHILIKYKILATTLEYEIEINRNL